MAEKKKKRPMTRWKKRGLIALCIVLGLVVGFGAGYFLHREIAKRSAATDSEPEVSATKPKPKKPDKPVKKYAQPGAVDLARVQQTMTYLSTNIGPRVAGSSQEAAAMQYLKARLEEFGYSVGVQQFALPGGKVSHNLICSDSGTSKDYIFVVGAHIDSRALSPGANDNASGCAMLLELARVLKGTKHFPEYWFVFFGAEEPGSTRQGGGRLGSSFFVKNIPSNDLQKVAGMISADTIAAGPTTAVRNYGPNSGRLAEKLVEAAGKAGLAVQHSPSGESDHMPFGQDGVPAAWLERLLPNNQDYLKNYIRDDKMSAIQPALVVEVGNFVRDYILALDKGRCVYLLKGTQ